MQSESKNPNDAKKRKSMSKADALEMLSSFFADLDRAGVRVDWQSEGGVVTLRLHDVAVAQDDEGTYFVPYVVQAVVEPAAQPQT